MTQIPWNVGRHRIVTIHDRHEKFWSLVRTGDGCWEWAGKVNRRTGYGEFYVGWNGRRHAHIRANRAAWILTHGDISSGVDVLHRCDNPICVNPQHLFIGDRFANMRDAVHKGRTHWQKAISAARLLKRTIHVRDAELLRRAAAGDDVSPERLTDLAARLEALVASVELVSEKPYDHKAEMARRRAARAEAA